MPNDDDADGQPDEAEQPTPDDDAADQESTDADALADGDFVRLDYTVRTVSDERVVDTTDEETASEAGLEDDDREFEPRTIVVGAGHLFPTVDEALVGAHVGDEGTVEIPAADAFGEADPDDIRTVSAEKIDEENRYPGAQVRIDGEQGYVETVVGGRARVDFNHPLAGEDLEYEYTVVERVEDRLERARSLLEINLGETPTVRIESDEVEQEVVVDGPSDDADDEAAETETETETETEVVDRETLYVEATQSMTMNQQWLFRKQQVGRELVDRIGVDRVVVEEEIAGGSGGGPMGGAGIQEALAGGDVDAEEIAAEIEAADE